jgi:hypothetical protein
MRTPALAIRQLTPDVLGFSAEDLEQLLTKHDLQKLRPTWTSKADTGTLHLAEVPGRDNILVRYEKLRTINLHALNGSVVRCNPDRIPEYIHAYERELRRISATGLYVPQHTQFVSTVPENPENAVFYTVVERLADTAHINPSDIDSPNSQACRAALRIAGLTGHYFLTRGDDSALLEGVVPPDHSGAVWLDDINGLHQFNNRALFDLESVLRNSPETPLKYWAHDVSLLPRSATRQAILHHLNSRNPDELLEVARNIAL